MSSPQRTTLRTELKWLAIGLIPCGLVVAAVFGPILYVAWAFRNFNLAGS